MKTRVKIVYARQFNELENEINIAIAELERTVTKPNIKDVKVTDVHNSNYLCATIIYDTK